MFKPLKDFLTFLQKNTNSYNSDGEIEEAPNIMDNIEPDGKGPANEFEPDKESKIFSLDVTKNCFVTSENDLLPSVFDADDIELHIKSNIMMKTQSSKSAAPSLSPTSITALSANSVTSLPNTSMTPTDYLKSFDADHNQNLEEKFHHISPEDDEELADFKSAPYISPSYDDYHSFNSESEEQVNSADEAVDRDRTEEEDALDITYPDLTVKREIFVVIDHDLNSSIAPSSADDPLAIDMCSLPTCSDDASNPLDNSTTEEAQADSPIKGLNWLEAEGNPSTNNSDAMPQKESPATAIQQPQQRRKSLVNITESIDTSRIEPNEEMERCDNSDSGLGTETSSLLLQATLNNSITESSSYQEYRPMSSNSSIDGTLTEIAVSSSSSSSKILTDSTPSSSPKPLRSNLKRRYCEESGEVERNCLSANRNTTDQDLLYQSKKPKRSINFDAVQVYYFPRQQGFGCVPSAGGCTLGMGAQHIDSKRLTLAEHAAELRRAHRLQLQEGNPRGSSSEETDESEEDYLSEGSGSDLDADSNGFLQPVTPKQRRAILKAAGIRKIDTSEKIDCRNIRNSREVCGCTCRDFCDPETCSCSRAGIKCQVDRSMFPCGCSRDACGNTTGRVEFNPARVRTHFIHTIMRLDMENRQQQQPMTLNGSPSSCAYEPTSTTTSSLSSVQSHTTKELNSISNHNGYFNMQTQSNYSSGYASPSYPNEHNANFYQEQSLSYTNPSEVRAIRETPFHSLDGVDGAVFAGTTNKSVPSYGEILPTYCPNDATGGTMQFNVSGYTTPLRYTPTYLPYQNDNDLNYLTASQECSTNNNNNKNNNNNNNSSSSIVSSAAENNVSSSREYGSDTNDSNYISLSAPVTSSSRLSQINDLLQHNRNTTAALVAVSQHSGGDSYLNTANNCVNNDSNLNISIEMPISNEGSKESLFFDSNHSRTPLTSVLGNSQQTSLENKTIDIAITTTIPIEYNSRVVVSDTV